MLNEELVDLIASTETVAVLGSGISVQAGLPSWSDLFELVGADLVKDVKDGFAIDPAKVRGSSKELPTAFQKLADASSRDRVHDLVRIHIENRKEPGILHRRLADWPFRLFVTTNYDHLLEDCGVQSAVGNRGRDVRSVSSDARDICWHLHGSSRLSAERSQLLVCSSDYDDFYPSSNALSVLRALLQTRRSVFIGFGFADPDLIHILKTVGRLTHGGRPSFAILGLEPRSRNEEPRRREEFRRDYNIEVISYVQRGADHSDLPRLLDLYEPFLVRRSMCHGQRAVRVEYDALASSMRIQAALDIGNIGADTTLRDSLLRSKILAFIREREPTDVPSVTAACAELAVGDGISKALYALRSSGRISTGAVLRLTENYHEVTADTEARFALARQQFSASLARRVAEHRSCPESDRARALEIASRFFEDLCRESGLGVAQNLASDSAEQVALRAVGLVRKLPEYLAECANQGQCHAVLEVVKAVLVAPAPAERVYLGHLCQAYFGQHLLGAVRSLQELDARLISKACIVLDASFLLCALAEGSSAYAFSSELVRDLLSAGTVLTTTDLFVEEVREHANWALELTQRYGDFSAEVLDAVRCLGGYRPNLFLEGYFLGECPDSSFAAYLSRVLGAPVGVRVRDADVSRRLEELRVAVLQFEEWGGFDQDLFPRRTQVQDQIGQRRRQLGTFKRERQTQAEAEVALVVHEIRAGRLRPPGHAVTDAFFLSRTRVVDNIPSLSRRICLLPAGVAQWLWASKCTSPKHGEFVFQQLLWSLAEEGIQFVDRSTLLRRFSGVVQAAREEIDAAIRDRRDYLVGKYGADPEKAFADADPLDLPRLASEVVREALARMQGEVELARQREEKARAEARMTQKERADLAVLRAANAEKRRKQKRRERAAESRKGPGRGRRKRKKK